MEKQEEINDRCPRCGGELTSYKSMWGGKGDIYVCTKCGTKIYDGGIVPPDDIVEYMSGKRKINTFAKSAK